MKTETFADWNTNEAQFNLIKWIKNIAEQLFSSFKPNAYMRGWLSLRNGEENPFAPGTNEHTEFEKGRQAGLTDCSV